MDLGLAAIGLGVGFIVGLTGMGGGALMTPLLVLFFGIPPLTAVSSDLATSAAMKPVGSLVHMRHGTIKWDLVKWLALGSVPSAFCGVLIIRALGAAHEVGAVVEICLGAALLLAAGSLVVKSYLRLLATMRRRRGETATVAVPTNFRVRPLPTVLVGILGGLVVGMTSVGSGSLMLISLLFLYPMLAPSQLVGTDLVQAVPLVLSAAGGHLLFGSVEFGLTLSLIIGSLPGVFLGAQLSARAPQGFIRRALSIVLFASGLKMLGMPNIPFVIVVGLALVLGPALWALVRVRFGLPPLVAQERGRQDEEKRLANTNSKPTEPRS